MMFLVVKGYSGRSGRAARKNAEKGASLIEFAIVAPLLFLLLFGVIEFARLVHGFTTVWTAAREGARYATTVGDTNSDGVPNYLDCDEIVAAAVAKAVAASLTSGDISVEYFDSTGTPVADCDVNPPAPASGGANIDSGFTIEVTASGTFDAVVPIVSGFLDGIDLSSTQTRSVFKGVVGET
jgi:Flp pilus assembly protein TadG